MNKKLLMLTMIPLVLSVMVTPVMAIGPQNAEKNPRRSEPAPGEVEILLPSGVGSGWVVNPELGVMDCWHFKDASKFKIRNAPTLGLDDLINLFGLGDLTYENKWCILGLGVLSDFIDLLVFMGEISEAEGEVMKAEFEEAFPEGMYFMFVNVGK
ncbi:MAG: hypothetical protein OEZ48_12710 [Candidatus Bathyarchaeota archaeon]|nr:hypothetical protein [Candidatus Bathyarchaeota archaeon]MDH5688706.1 hypothetical protein [Candidatus Bathyarchaeota archaeon]